MVGVEKPRDGRAVIDGEVIIGFQANRQRVEELLA